MDKFEVSLALLKEAISHKSTDKTELLEKAKEILEAFEEIYKKISELETPSNASSPEDEKSSFDQAIEEATRTKSYLSFQEIMNSKISEEPQLFNCLDCPPTSSDKLRNAFAAALPEPSFEGFKSTFDQAFNLSDLDEVKCPRQKCVIHGFVEAINTESSEVEFFEKIMRK